MVASVQRLLLPMSKEFYVPALNVTSNVSSAQDGASGTSIRIKGSFI